MKHISFLLHCYQPPWQDVNTLRRICRKCYNPLFEWLVSAQEIPITLNINFSLVEILHTFNHKKALQLIKKLAGLGRVDFAGSGAYHPILPLILPRECERQIYLNEDGFHRILGFDIPKRGFFPPEMACNKEVAAMVKNDGYSWLIMDDQSFVQRYGYAPFNFIPMTDGLPVIMRSNYWSNNLAFKKIAGAKNFYDKLLTDLGNWFGKSDGYLVIALDGETFGGHEGTGGYLNFLRRLCELIAKNGIQLTTVSQIVDRFPKKEMLIPSGSWSTLREDMARGIYYPQWNHPENKFHQALWELIEILQPRIRDDDTANRGLMDKALNSCQFWWLTPEHWNPTNAFRTFPFYQEIIKWLNLPDTDRQKIKKIFETLKAGTGLKIQT